MESHLFLRDAFECIIHRVDSRLDEVEIIVDGRLWVDLIEAFGYRRIINLQFQAGVGNCLVFLVESIGPGEQELLVAAIVFIAHTSRRARGHGRDETRTDTFAGQGCLEVANIFGNGILPDVGNRPDHAGIRGCGLPRQNRPVRIGVDIPETSPITPVKEGGVLQMPRRTSHRGRIEGIGIGNAQTSDALRDVIPPRSIVDR
jgi:hypothetical protein